MSSTRQAAETTPESVRSLTTSGYVVRVEPMQPADIAAVADIERRSQPAPWPVSAFADELEREWARVEVARAYPAAAYSSEQNSGKLVAAPKSLDNPREPRVIGFCNYWLVADEAQLLNLVTAPSWRRRGVARQLMDALLDRARAHSCTVITLEVRASNLAAQALYRAYRFREVAVRRAYYSDNREDAVLMDLAL